MDQDQDKEIGELHKLLRQEHEARSRAEREAAELYSMLHSLTLEAKCYAGVSKHLMHVCEEAEQLINKKTEHEDK